MRGYWSSNSGGVSAPSPAGEIDNSKIIGLPPIIYATLNNNLSANTKSFLPTSLISFPATTALNSYWNYQLKDVSSYLTKSLGTDFKGYTNLYNQINTEDYKLEFKNPNNTTITSQKVYDVGCVLIKFTPSWNCPAIQKTPYASLNYVSQAYREFLQPNLHNYIPTWTGDFGIPWATGGSSTATMKQNKHYIGFGKNSPTEETNLLNGNFLNRFANAQDKQLLTNSVFYQDFNSGQLDNCWSAPNPHGSVLRSLWGGSPFATTSLTDIIKNSVSEMGLPFFIDNRGCGLGFYTSMQFQSFTKNELKKTYMSTQNIYNTLFGKYGFTQVDSSKYVVLPKITSNQMVYGGDGSGILDCPVIDNYTYNGKNFAATSPSRYMYIDTTYSLVNGVPKYTTYSIYLMLTYLKNDVITLTNTGGGNYFGHYRINNANGIIE